MAARHVITLALVALRGVPVAAHAQRPPDSTRTHALCWTAQPKPRCSVLLLTNTGAYTGPRFVGDLGLMVNVNPRHAVGASLLVASDPSGLFTMGASVRYRRWMSDGGALDLAVGYRGAFRSTDQGAVMGLIKYNFGPYFGLALRPEILRNCVMRCQHLSVGFEIGSWPGALAPVVGGLIGLVALVANPPHIP